MLDIDNSQFPAERDLQIVVESEYEKFANDAKEFFGKKPTEVYEYLNNHYKKLSEVPLKMSNINYNNKENNNYMFFYFLKDGFAWLELFSMNKPFYYRKESNELFISGHSRQDDSEKKYILKVDDSIHT